MLLCRPYLLSRRYPVFRTGNRTSTFEERLFANQIRWRNDGRGYQQRILCEPRNQRNTEEKVLIDGILLSNILISLIPLLSILFDSFSSYLGRKTILSCLMITLTLWARLSTIQILFHLIYHLLQRTQPNQTYSSSALISLPTSPPS